MASRKNILFLFGMVLSALLLDGFSTYRNLLRWSEDNQWVVHTQKVIISIEEVRSSFRFFVNRYQAYLLTRDNGYLSDLENSSHQRLKNLDLLRGLTEDNPDQQKRLEGIKALADAQDEIYQKSLQAWKKGKANHPQELAWANELNRLADQIREKAIAATNQENTILLGRTAESSKTFRQTLLIFGISLFATILLVLFAAYLLIRNTWARGQLRQSELRLSTVIQNAPLILYSLDNKGVVTLSVGKGLEAIGLKPGGSVGKSIFDTYSQNSSILEKVRKALAGEEAHGLVDVNGSTVEALYKPIKDSRGKVTEVVGVAIDVTARRKAQEALEGKTRLLDSVMDNMSEGIVVADQSGKMVYFNKGAEKIIGIGMSEKSSSEWTKEYGVFQEDKITPFLENDLPLVKAVRGIHSVGIVQFLKNSGHPDGIFINVTGWPLRDDKGNNSGGLVVVRDITEQINNEEKFKDYTRKLEENNRDLQDFVFVASHDLQEPLRKIQSFGEFLRDEFNETLGETGRDYVERMRSAAKRMQILINDLLALTRVTTKAQPFAQVDLSQVLKEVLVDLETRVQEKNAKIESGPLPTLEADATQMRQLLQNLISNALKFQKTGVSPLIQINARENGRNLSQITVKDNGIGFDNKYGDQIFKVFERLHGRDEYEGTGIGLAICRKVVERHGGKIKAEGSPGKGSIFTVELPFRQKL